MIDLSTRRIRSGPYKIGRKFSAEFDLTGDRLTVIWDPHPPFGQKGVLRDYKRARHHFLTRAAELLGGSIAVMDVH